MKKEILFLLPVGTLTPEETAIYSKENPHILFESIDYSNPIDHLKNTITKHDIKVAVGRGYTEEYLHKFFKDVNIISIQVTAYDVLRALPKNFYGIISIITCKLKITGLKLISNIFNINILDYTLTNFKDINNAILDSVNNGASIIIGGSITINHIKNLNVNIQTSILPCGEESIKTAIYEANNLLEAIKSEHREQEFVIKSMDLLQQGIISIRDGIICLINTEAEKILGCDRNYFTNLGVENLPSEFTDWEKIDSDEKVVNFRGNDIHLTKVTKKDSINSFIISIQTKKDIEKKEEKVRIESYVKPSGIHYSFADIKGMSPEISNTITIAKKYANSNSSILITGESGCGKEVFAQSIHYESSRKIYPFIAVNCASFTKDLVRSELFGYVEGSFTGASKQGKAGIFEMAHRGTVFLDEISEMDYSLQASLLRVLQEGYIVRIGSNKIIPVDTRIIAATNKNLAQLAFNGLFRVDLYYRLNVLPLHIPTLRERKMDIYPIIITMMNKNIALGEKKYSFDHAAKSLLEQYNWPGNIRELSNVAQRLLVTSNSKTITAPILRSALLIPQDETLIETNDIDKVRQQKYKAQAEEIRQVIEESHGNLSEAARRLHIDRTTLWRRLKKFQIS